MKFRLCIILLALIIVIALTSCKTNEDSEEIGDNPNENEINNDETELRNQVFSVGDIMEMGNVKICVNGLRESNGGEFFGPDEGNKYLMTDISVYNTSDEFENISSLMLFRLVDKEGVSYDITIGSDTVGNLDRNLGPGRKMRGELAFEVPEELNEFELEINSEFGDNNLLIVEINSEDIGGDYFGAFAEVTSDEMEHFSITDTIELNAYRLTVNNINISQGEDFETPEEGFAYLLVDLTLENIGNENQSVSSLMMFNLVDKEGINYDHAIYTKAKGSLDGSLGVGRKMRGELVFEVPKAKDYFELEFTDDIFNDEVMIIDLPIR